MRVFPLVEIANMLKAQPDRGWRRSSFGYQDGSPEEAAAQFNRILLDLGTKVADAKDRPKWNDNKFFRRFAQVSD
jgi:hypothetical protein